MICVQRYGIDCDLKNGGLFAALTDKQARHLESHKGPFWISSNGAGTSTLYSVNPLTQATTKVGLTVTIPGAGNVTGQVFNPGGASQFGGNPFLFVGEDGTVSGWRGALGTMAEHFNTLPAIRKGAAYGNVGGTSYLYAADFRSGGVAVFKGSAAAPSPSGNFQDPTLPWGYGAFNVQALGSSLYVTYAKQDPNSPDELASAGPRSVDRFDLQGQFVGRVASGGALNAPWGMAIAPAGFGAWSSALLVATSAMGASAPTTGRPTPSSASSAAQTARRSRRHLKSTIPATAQRSSSADRGVAGLFAAPGSGNADRRLRPRRPWRRPRSPRRRRWRRVRSTAAERP